MMDTANKGAGPSPPGDSGIRPKRPGLKDIAAYLNLSPATVSMVLNDVPLARALTEETRARVREAALQFNYRPNLMARTLIGKESRTIGVIVPDSTDGDFTRVMRGIEEALLDMGYLYFTVSHLGREELSRQYPSLLLQRAVDGLIFLNTEIWETPEIPAVSVSFASSQPGVTSVLTDQKAGVQLALAHLAELGHKRVMLMKGQRSRLESGERWHAMRHCAQELGMEVAAEVILDWEEDTQFPEIARRQVKNAIVHNPGFTAICAFNDMSAMGALRAIADAGLHCPRDISVTGFDDVNFAAYLTPRLTTVYQPLEEMGRAAVAQLLPQSREPGPRSPAQIVLQPRLVVRESTGPVRPGLA